MAFEHDIYTLPDYGHGRTPQEQVIPKPTERYIEGAEAVLSGNPITIAQEVLKTLRTMEARGRLRDEAERKAYERYHRAVAERDVWQSFGFRYDPSEGVRQMEFTHGSSMNFLQITTAATNGAGFFYVSFINPIQLDAQNRPQPETWEQVSAIGGPSITLPIPRETPNVYWFSTVRHEGTIYVASSKDAIPS